MLKIATHPNNRAYVEEHFRDQLRDSIFGIELLLNPHLEERRMEQVWSAPEGDRFCEYGPEDESWMRPLGIGVRTEDRGPLFYAIDPSLFRFDFKPLAIEPRYLIKNVCF